MNPTASYRRVAIIIASALFMENLDATVLATAIPTMAHDFSVRAPEMSIALTAYLIALALFIPASGHAADRFGAKRVFSAAIMIFVVGSLCCAMAPTLEVLAAARFLQGIGGAMMVPVGRLVLLRNVSKQDLVAASSWLLMPGLIGQIVGPPVGGFIVTALNWHWIFWVNLPIGLAGFYLTRRFITDTEVTHQRPFDGRGFLLSGIALSTAMFAIEVGGRGGRGTFVLPFLTLAVIAGALYVWHAKRVTHPILDLQLLRIPTFRLSVIGGSLTRITQGAQPFLLPLMMQLGFGFTAAQSGMITLGTSVGTFTMKSLVVRIIRRWGFRSSLCVIGVLGASSYAICGFFRPTWPVFAIYAVLIMSGFLMSFQFTAYNTIAYDEIEAPRMSSATSFYSTFQQLTLSLGICVAASILQVTMAIGGRQKPIFSDFSTAFWIVTAISFCSIFANIRFDKSAGNEMRGRQSK